MMRTAILCILSALAGACAAPKSAPPLPAPIAEKSFDAASAEAGEQILRRKVRYLEVLYEQSVEPYYGTPKWSAECLRETWIGKVDPATLVAVSELYLNAANQPGGCPGGAGARRAFYVLVYCPTTKLVRELTFDYAPALAFARENLCPPRF